MNLGLSPEALSERRKGVGGSDARIVVHGTPEERYRLYQEKIGEAKSRKIMSDWAYAWRMTTEKLQLDWYERCNPDEIVHCRGEVRVSRAHPFMRCTLDGLVLPRASLHLGGDLYDVGVGIPINAKHLSKWTKEAREWAIEHYTPQITHEAIVCNADYGLISLLHGEKEPEIIKIEVDPFYAEHMIEREREFMDCVSRQVAPSDAADLATPKAAIVVEKLKTVHLDGDPQAEHGTPAWHLAQAWPNWAGEAIDLIDKFIGTEKAAKLHAIVREDLKKLVPEDVGELTYGGFTLKRSRVGAVTMTGAK